MTQQNPRKIFQQTKEVVRYSLQYVKGDTLDLGAGTAKYRGLIQEKAGSYTTFDLVPGEHIDATGDLLHTGYLDEQFSTVYSTQVFEHIPYPWLVIREIHRILKPGGIAIITAPFLQPYHADPHDYYRYTVEGMEALAIDAGFEIVESGYYAKLFTVISEAIHHTIFSPYKKKKPGADTIMKALSRCARFLDRFVRTKKIYGNVFCIIRKPQKNQS